MISFTVRLRFRPEDREEIAGFLRELAGASRREPGCVSYIPHTSSPTRIRSSSTSNTVTKPPSKPIAPPRILPGGLLAAFISACSTVRWKT